MHERRAHRAREAEREPHVTPVRHDVELGAARRRDGPRARHRPVRDDAVEPPARQLAPRLHHPRRRAHRPRRLLVHARRETGPPEGVDPLRRNDRHLAAPRQRARVAGDEVPARVPVEPRPARRHQGDAHEPLPFRRPRRRARIPCGRAIPMSERTVTIRGRILYLTEDLAKVESQLAGANLPTSTNGRAAPRQHLDRRDHARVGLLLLRRDARPLLPRRPARRRGRSRRDQERRLRRHRQRHLEGVRLSSRETAPYSELEGGRAARHRQEHREDLRPERAEHRPPHEHRLRAPRRASSAARRSR